MSCVDQTDSLIVKSSVNHTEDEDFTENFERLQMKQLGLPLKFGKRRQTPNRKRKRSNHCNDQSFTSTATTETDQSKDMNDLVEEIHTIKLSNSADDYMNLDELKQSEEIENFIDQNDLDRNNFEVTILDDQGIKKKRRYKKPKYVTQNYWNQRFILFSRFNQGICLDKESWYSVTPEPIARHISAKIVDALTSREERKFIILDGFCGAGGNTIQFALSPSVALVIAIDVDPKKIEMAKHNASIYECDQKIEFIIGDYLQVIQSERFRGKVDCCFLSPPWGGPTYNKMQKYSLNQMNPNGFEICASTAAHLTSNISFLLPRNIDLDEIEQLSKAIYSDGDRKVEIENNMIYTKVKTITAYFGQLISEQDGKKESMIIE